MKGGGRIYLIAGVGLALLAGALVFLYLSNLSGQATAQPTPTPIPDVDVIVLTKDAKAGTLITSDMLKRETRKGNLVAPDMVRSPAEVVDQLMLVETKAGTVLRRGDILPLPFVLPKGKKAMAFSVDNLSTIAGIIRERDFIDILISTKIKIATPDPKAATPGARPTPTPTPRPRQTGEGGDEEVTLLQPNDQQVVVKAVLQRIQVLKVIAPPPPQAQQGRGTPVPATPTPAVTGTPAQQAPQGTITNQPTVLVLAVSDQEAEVLRFARDSGQMQFIMRGRDDSDSEETKGMTLDILIQDYGLPVPRPLVVTVREAKPQ